MSQSVQMSDFPTHSGPGSRPGPPSSTNILGANPMLPLHGGQLADAVAILLQLLAAHPRTVLRHQLGLVRELSQLGLRSLRPDNDRVVQFRAGAWRQAHVLISRRLNAILDDIAAPAVTTRRARFALTHLLEATSPDHHRDGLAGLTGELLSTRGRSLLTGLRHLFDDLLNNHALPRLVDERPFRVGQNIAATPGRVVWRNPVCEVIQYGASTENVLNRPLLIVPPQINKFYLLDLSPQNSFVRWATAQQVPVFAISWRNPTARQRDWGLEIYIHTLGDAVEVVRDISGAHSVNLLAPCMAAITATIFVAMRASSARQSTINSLTLLTSTLDTTDPTLLGLFADNAAIERAIAESRESGVMDGARMARAWSWLQPRDMIWSRATNNYLMGRVPPARDILYWNNDTTRLPAQLHAELLRLYQRNALSGSNNLRVLGADIDLKRVTVPIYLAAGELDQVVPWHSSWATAELFGGSKRFVLYEGSHTDTLICPPGDQARGYRSDGARTETAEQWRDTAQWHAGSWWNDWLAWLRPLSDGHRPAPQEYGSARHSAGDAAPGRYIFQR